jgi:hypothetical protein
MKISTVIKKLTKIKDKIGDVELIVDTEAGTFPVHCVTVE